MPLYTYVVCYRGTTHLCQARRSNFRGFGDWVKELPRDGFGAAATRAIEAQRYGGFEAVPNRTHVWQKRFMVDGDAFVVTAVDTKD